MTILIDILLIIPTIWILSGGLIVICAVEFLRISPTMLKMIAGIIMWPWALNRDAWQKELDNVKQ